MKPPVGFCDLFLAIPILYPLLSTRKPGFLVFSVGIKWERWPELGQYICIYQVVTYSYTVVPLTNGCTNVALNFFATDFQQLMSS